jgi:hypothetical protein
MSNDNITIQVAWTTIFPRSVAAMLGGLQGVGKSRKAAGEDLGRQIAAKLQHEEKRAIVMAKDGTLLVGHTEANGFQYAMTGGDRETAWTCGCAIGYDNMVAAMQRHAEACYGGVAWTRRV